MKGGAPSFCNFTGEIIFPESETNATGNTSDHVKYIICIQGNISSANKVIQLNQRIKKYMALLGQIYSFLEPNQLEFLPN